MNELEVRDFEWQDYVTINKTPVEDISKVVGDVDTYARGLWANGPAYTVWKDDLPVMSCGIRITQKGTGEIWCHANELASATTRGRALIVYAKAIFDKCWEEGKFTCAMALFKPEVGRLKMCKALALDRIGIIPNFTADDQPVVLFVRTK